MPLTTTNLNTRNISLECIPSAIKPDESVDVLVKENRIDRESEDVIKEEQSLDCSAKSDLENHYYQVRSTCYSNIRYTYLNTYRRLFSIVFVANLVGYSLTWIYHRNIFSFIDGAAVNLLLCGMMRQPLVVNSLYYLACRIPRSAPLQLRILAAKIFHFGGVHSGCGVATAIWYMTFVGFLTHRFARIKGSHTYASIAVLVMAYCVTILLSGIIVVAHPTFRSKFHDQFERIHRFGGWITILMFWPFLITFASEQKPSTAAFLLHQPTFWILFLLTAAIIQPWVMLRKVKVVSEKLSNHAVRLHFDFTTTKFGQGISIARHPLLDWHSFAGFPDRFDNPETNFSLVVSRAGDFTGDLIENPPDHIWKRAGPTYGFGKVLGLFKRIVVITTGSGIGPCLSFIDDENRPKMRILWQTKEPLKTYGERIISLVRRMDPNPVIMTLTRDIHGKRVDMLPYVLNLYREFDAEAVCVISNAQNTKRLVFELERRGIVAMGPIWDS